MVVLFHYTNKAAAESIAASKLLIKSKDEPGKDDTTFGEGTYFTTLSPYNDKFEIIENNWDDSYSQDALIKAVEEGKVAYAIKVYFPDDFPNLEKCECEDRDVWRYIDSDVNLEELELEFEVIQFEDFPVLEAVNHFGRLLLRLITLAAKESG
jgi:hypothetical protein